MPVSDAQKRARNKYDAQHYTVTGCKIRKEYAEAFRARCEQYDTTPGAVLRAALDAFMETHPARDPGSAQQARGTTINLLIP